KIIGAGPGSRNLGSGLGEENLVIGVGKSVHEEERHKTSARMLNTGSWAGKVEAEQAVNPLNDGAMGTATETEGSTAVDSLFSDSQTSKLMG
ncbi:hypothetical protein FRX31_007417, partial [Thalictrum thalictroides]